MKRKRMRFLRQAHKEAALPWEEIVSMMADKELSFEDEVLQIIYSADKSARCIVLKSEKGWVYYVIEKLYPFDEEEWHWLGEDNLPAYWQPLGEGYRSLYGTEEEALRGLTAEPNYKIYFEA